MNDPRNPTGEDRSPEPMQDSGQTTSPGIDLRTVEFLGYLELGDEVFNKDVMDKIEYLTERMDIDELRHVDLSLEKDGTPRLDKIYFHQQLVDEENRILREQELIREQRKRLML